jgi:MazG family protein
MSETPPSSQATERLLEIMARLRAPDGCAWDREQTPATLKSQMLEECYEVMEAIDSGSRDLLLEELGDLLLHVVFQAQIAAEQGDFTFADVAAGIAEKLVRRHPHVFGEVKLADSASVLVQWEELKKAEKPERKSALDGIPRALPALMRADAIQRRARKVGFDWPDATGALEKVREEVQEVAAAMSEAAAFAHANEAAAEVSPQIEEEIGDILFSVVNLSRHLKLDAEELLRRATDKFEQRFRNVEQQAQAAGKKLETCTAGELDTFWEVAKVGKR